MSRENLPIAGGRVKMPCQLYCDTRLGGEKRWILASEPVDPMQINQDVLQCVAFLGHKKMLANGDTEIVPSGTVFFVAYPLSPGREAVYAVTARHVIEGIEKEGMDALPYLRLNRPEGAEWCQIARKQWVFPDDPTVDVAIASLAGIVLGNGNNTVPLKMFVTDRILADHRIGSGHDVFFPGLFSNHAGTERNMPVMRTGSIAAMPTERVRTDWNSIHAYLIEARSIGGLSGSPVFVQSGPIRYSDAEGYKCTFGNIEYFLLGLVQGHYGVDILSVGPVQGDPLRKSLNMGIAIVVRAGDIIAALEHPTFAAQREANERARQSRGQGSAD
jgi:hypothetical protein